MKMLCEQLVTALGSCGVDAVLPDPEPTGREGWEVAFDVATNRYTNAAGDRRLELVAYFTANGKWLFVYAQDAYPLEPSNSSSLSVAQEAVEMPNSNPAWMSEYEVDAQRQAITVSVRTCVAGAGCLRNLVQHLLDDMIHSVDYYHDLMQIAVQHGQYIPALIRDSGYVASLVDAASEEEEEQEEEEEEEDDEEEVDEEPGNFQPPPASGRRQLPWE